MKTKTGSVLNKAKNCKLKRRVSTLLKDHQE